MKKHKLFICLDCGMDTWDEYYMVHDELWNSVVKGRGMLCIKCLETRLGWQLTKKDFTNCPINDLDIFDDRNDILKNRLNDE